jgi:hypothetical protein
VYADGKLNSVCGTGISDSSLQRIVLTSPRNVPNSTPLTDLNQAEDIPPLGSSPLPDPQFRRINSAGKKKESML